MAKISTDAAPPLLYDGSVWALVAVNVLSLAIAYIQDWSTLSLMVLFWGQNIIIGIANVFRMLALDNYTASSRTPTVEWKILMTLFFIFHYGLIHLIYIIFLASFTYGEGAGNVRLLGDLFKPLGGILSETGFLICMAGFALNHFFSYRYNREIDRQGTPNIYRLMFTPYFRVVPMHIIIIIFLETSRTSTVSNLLLFGILKITGDVGMHVIEHIQLRKIRNQT